MRWRLTDAAALNDPIPDLARGQSPRKDLLGMRSVLIQRRRRRPQRRPLSRRIAARAGARRRLLGASVGDGADRSKREAGRAGEGEMQQRRRHAQGSAKGTAERRIKVEKKQSFRSAQSPRVRSRAVRSSELSIDAS
jgi:chromatin segregation and condensation protein Rec8/ScpA/Scc1 (kleisin family)